MKEIRLRIALAISLDGKIANFKGEKAQLGGPGDRQVLEEALAWSDATLMGGETLRQHKSVCLIHKDNLIQKRLDNNKSTQPISIVISNQEKYSLDYPYFNQPIERWLITSNPNLLNSNKIKGYDKTIRFELNWSKTLLKLSENRISKLLILGGSQLIGSLILEDKVNELQLTITPKLIGGEITWIPIKQNMPDIMSASNSWILQEHRNLDNNEILLFYCRNTNISDESRINSI